MTSEAEAFFSRKLADVARAFDQSDIKKYQESLRAPGRPDGQWYYSLTAVPFHRNKPVLMGLNWGVDRAHGHTAQANYPDKRAWLEIADYSHIRTDRTRIEAKVGPLSDLNYFNVCPFRTVEIAQLTTADWRLAIESFFDETVNFLAPPVAVFLGTSGVRELRRVGLANYRDVVVRGDNKSSTGHVGVLLAGATQVPFVAIPRPRDMHSEKQKDALWQEVFSTLT